MKPPLLIDNFAGGGGASTGIEAAMGRSVDVAINHDEAAIAVHTANHPGTRHYCQSIYSVDPLDATGGEPVLLAWFSPDCKHHSKAKGGKPREKYIRDMAHVVPHWIERLQRATPGGRGAPRVIMLENVEEFRQWGPLDADGMPIKERQGEEFDLWVRRIRRLGYKVEWRELRACDYGAPTSRKRLFLVARCDGLPIVWPEPTHGHPDSEGVRSGQLLPWRTAAECIDWSIPCPSIFDRKRALKDATNRRIAAGTMRYVVNAARPFIVPLTHAGGPQRAYDMDAPLPTVTGAHRGEMAFVSPGIVPITHTQGSNIARPADEPLRTITTAKGGELALSAASLIKLRNNSTCEDPAAPLGTITSGGIHHGIAAASLIQMGYGERQGQAPRALDAQEPLGTVVAGGGKHAAVAAFLAQHNSERGNGVKAGRTVEAPISTITGSGTQQQVVASFLHKYRQNSTGSAADAPMPTVTANSFIKRSGGAAPISVVQTTMVEADALPPELMRRAVMTAAFLVKYYGSEVGQHQAVDQPLDTITVQARFAVVTVTIDAVTFVLVDIGMRMLEPRELANAQGFPPDYVLDPVCTYRTDSGNLKQGPLPKSHQIAKIGNSVCPPMSEALARANLPSAMAAMIAERAAA